MKNPDHKPYREKYLNIRDDLMLSTGREHWEKVDTAAAVEAVVRQRQAVFGSPGTLDKERLQPRSERTDAVPPTAERQDKRVERPDSVDGVSATARRRGRIWPEAQAMTGKQFKDHVITETTIYGSSKDAAFRIAGKLTDADLDSGAMRTTEGLAGLRALNSAMNPEGISSALTGLSAAEMKEKVRIATAAAKIENELYPRISHRKGLEAFSKNFPRYAEELRKGIEKQKGYKVERIYHRPFKGDSKEMRATITVSREISDRHGEVHTI
ncbi:MAG: hypothetical protein GTN65_11410, partial [Armatimonadetes bacterium]|nr:hypothetical protein [Armatimonadota bacterium]NIO97674.1 hypothetical protein [Armatimonadota bacterium]